MKRGDMLHIRLDDFAFEGKSVSRSDGMVIFVRGGVPGDEVHARIVKVKRRYAEAETEEILTASPLRGQARCRYVGVCGGCPWQEVNYEAQLEFKRRHVLDALERVGGFPGVRVPPTIGAEESYFYRNKMEFSFGEKWLTRDELERKRGQSNDADGMERVALGLHIPGRFDRVLDLEECWLQSTTSARIVNIVRAFCRQRRLTMYSTRSHEGYLRNLVLRESKRTRELMVNVVTRDDRPDVLRELTDLLVAEVPSITTIVNNITERKSQVAIGDTENVYYGAGFITEQLGKRQYRISANSFFQTNTAQAERLYDVARRLARLRPGDVVFDLYSGTGTIALHIADDVAEVVGIEATPSAVADAQANALANGVRNCMFVLGDLKEKLTRDRVWLEQHERPTAMIIDPPRAGMHEKVVHEIRSLSPERIAYVSCNPMTQARDLKLLCEHGAYRIDEVQPVDMFPHTYHVESVAGLSLGTPDREGNQ